MDLHVKPILINIFALCRLCLTTVSYRLKLEAVLVYSVRRTIFFLDYFFILPNLWDWHFGLHTVPVRLCYLQSSLLFIRTSSVI